MNVFHVLPVNDLVVHDEQGVDCVCGVDVEYVIGCAGEHGKLVVHHALDNREHDEGAPTS